MLIGDPKQAIYAFRGADVYAYLRPRARRRRTRDARRQLAQRPGPHRRLRRAVRRRAARPRGDRLPHGRARADAPRAPRLHGAPVDAALRMRVVHRDEPGDRRTTRAGLRDDRVRARARRRRPRRRPRARCCRRTRRSRSAARRAPSAQPCARRHRRARAHATAAPQLVRDALDDVGVPAVINGAGSVFATDGRAATGCACSRRSSGRRLGPRARAAALTPFLGLDAPSSVAAAATRTLGGRPPPPARLGARAAHARRRVADRRRSRSSEGLPERVLARDDGERRLTDLRHVGQLLHARGDDRAASARPRCGVAAPRASREAERRQRRRGPQPAPGVRRRGRPGPDDPPQQGPRVPDRLLPVPVGRLAYDPARRQPVVFHDPDAAISARSTSALDGPGLRTPTPPAASSRAARRGPAARLRRADARAPPGGRLVGGLAATAATRRSAGCCSRATTTAPSPPRRHVRADRRGGDRARSTQLAATAPGCVSRRARRARGRRPQWTGAGRPPRELAAARFDRELDRRWRRTSYSDITAGTPRGAGRQRARGGGRRRRGVAARPRRRPPRPTARDEAALRAVPSLLGDMPAGVARRHVRAPRARGDRLRRARPRRRARGPRRGACRRAGRSTSAMPRASWPGCAPRSRRRSDRCSATARGCATSPRADRLDELDFELPLVGGDDPTGRADARRDRRRAASRTCPRRPARRVRRPARATRLCARASAAT